MLAVSTDLADMKVADLKEELLCRGKPCWGPKPLLQRRLHAAIVCAVIEEPDESEYNSDASSDS